MGKIILCSGPVAARPYLIKLTNQHIYSLEELCYVIYQNIYVLTADTFDDALFSWLDEEIDEKKLARRLRLLKGQEAAPVDYVAAILGASDYYTESEVRNTLQLMRRMGDFSPVEKWKLQGDSYLEHGNYAQAAQEYEMLLASDGVSSLRAREAGSVKHNLGIAHLYTGTFAQAADEFLQAARLSEDQASYMASQEARKLADGEISAADTAGEKPVGPEQIDACIEGWKEELRKAFERK